MAARSASVWPTPPDAGRWARALLAAPVEAAAGLVAGFANQALFQRAAAGDGFLYFRDIAGQVVLIQTASWAFLGAVIGLALRFESTLTWPRSLAGGALGGVAGGLLFELSSPPRRPTTSTPRSGPATA